ncbi:MAG: hypothetical protein ACOX69_02125 [Coriobacteriales bacterium]|jgi:hypothetical protein
MAIDWNREIHLSGKSSAAQEGYPTKTTMNFMADGSGGHEKRLRIARIIAASLVVVLFMCLCIGYPLFQVSQKKGELSEAQQVLAPLAASVADYDSVLSEYQSYQPTLNENGIDGLSLVRLVEDKVRPRCTVLSTQLADTELTIKVTGVSLKKAGAIANELAKEDGVQSAAVSLAEDSSTSTGAHVVCDITVKLQGADSMGGN